MFLNKINKYIYVKNILTSEISIFNIPQRFKKTLDYSKYPKLIESELEEMHVRGSGPGGQAVNKTSNAVVLKHIPTKIVVKCHIHRSLTENRKEARKILLNKLDILYNGENSIDAQEKVISQKKLNEKIQRRKKIEAMKEIWKKNEGND
ncbi:mitochondrial translation release factor in rescue [Condylostylus longicornis]|uniref:mitochondrial translation release factor in rescue n=1 Tax=Condylostylus longicornis TaxID=2530218 RepID=UPI00244E5B00|nr:mitochondrial translation release factor in rescue [Condylostylus longicornis]